MISNELKYAIEFVIGDGHLKKYDRSFHYKLEHSTKQKDYFLHKCGILESIGFTGLYRENVKVINSKEYHTLSFTAHVNDIIKTAYKWVDNNGRKSIDKRLLSVLDGRSLAYWYMDDGSASMENKSSSSPKNGFRYYYTYPVRKLSQIRLYTYAFTEQENSLIIDWAKSNFDLNFNMVHGTRDGIYLKLSKLEERKKFIAIVKPHIIQSMQYKIDGVLSYDGIKPIDVCRKRLSEETPTDFSEGDATVRGRVEPA
jgi:hypothetical protein